MTVAGEGSRESGKSGRKQGKRDFDARGGAGVSETLARNTLTKVVAVDAV